MSRVILATTLLVAPLAFLAAASCSSFSSFSQLLAVDAAADAAVVAPDAGSLADVSVATDAAKDAGFCANYDAAAARYHIFVSSNAVSGRFAADAGSPQAALAIADALCTQLGLKVNPCSRWRALLSAGGEDPRPRMAPVPGALYRVRDDAGPISQSTEFEGFLGVVPIFDEDGASLASGERVWTGFGNGLAGACSGWQGTGPGVVGDPGNAIYWLFAKDDRDRICIQSHHLYCVEQPP